MTRPKGTSQVVVNIPTEDYAEFKRNYPAHGSLTWFIRECIRRYNDIHAEKPEELIGMVVESIRGDAEENEDDR